MTGPRRLVLAAALGLALVLYARGPSAQTVERSGQGGTVVREPGAQSGAVRQEAGPKVDRSTLQPRRAGTGRAEPALPPERFLEMGWEKFSAGQWAEAEAAFAQALAADPTGPSASRARLGLGWACQRQGRLGEAREHFEKAVQAGFNPEEAVPALLGVLQTLGDRAAMDRYLPLLPQEQRARWASAAPPAPSPGEAPKARAPQTRTLRELFAEAGPNPSANTLEKLLSRFSAGLAVCSDGDVFLKIAQKLPDKKRAVSVLDRLLRCKRLDFGVRLGALYELAAVGGPDAARDHLYRFHEASPSLPAGQDRALADLAQSLDKTEMASPGLAREKKLALARSILAASPSDPDALAALAWDDLASGRHEAALEIFDRLAASNPDRAEYRLGRGYGLFQLGRLDEALDVAAAELESGPDFKELAYQVHVKKAFQAVEAKYFALASDEAAKALALRPDGQEAREATAWAALGVGDNARAYALFRELHRSGPDGRFLPPMARSLVREGRRTEAFQVAGEMASWASPEIRREAASFYREQNAPLMAAKASGPADCCANADAPTLTALGFVRGKTGDSGLSRLTEWTSLAAFSVAGGDNWRLAGSYSPSLLSSGSAPPAPYAGSYYARAQGVPQRNSLATDLVVHTPRLFLDVEGPYRWRFEAGSTPLGGPVGPMPTFSAALSTPTWEIRLQQKPVTETILSWVGQRDPYGSKNWGRVLRTGLRASATFAPLENWFASLGGGADYLWGENVAGNLALHANASAGRTVNLGDNELALGLFASFKHYGRNLNFQTYGHGGYYSPDLFFLAGPFVRLRSAPCKPYWFDLEGSLGFMAEQNAAAPKYPLLGAPAFGLSSAQLQEFTGSYPGKSENKFSYSARGEALRLLTPYLAAGVFGGLSNAADYREAYGGLGLRVFFRPQAGFWAPKDFARGVSPADRD